MAFFNAIVLISLTSVVSAARTKRIVNADEWNPESGQLTLENMEQLSPDGKKLFDVLVHPTKRANAGFWFANPTVTDDHYVGANGKNYYTVHMDSNMNFCPKVLIQMRYNDMKTMWEKRQQISRDTTGSASKDIFEGLELPGTRGVWGRVGWSFGIPSSVEEEQQQPSNRAEFLQAMLKRIFATASGGHVLVSDPKYVQLLESFKTNLHLQAMNDPVNPVFGLYECADS